ncbi:hypothetical protein PF005_g15763 [Phytophthora fragariae]|uniref:Pectate lyase domain-containing protein n=1 Tax=Phytophthora fragariae TaxID=53985 RepID=A0A6A3XKL9_9STRA|nr:hypothetical protein PF011_g15319 [Phytophthora fragariae]KAE9098157.1 hypothetical protein PF010_g15665 [Phytophthora fragariae]KAE9125990.1 hypothetical protein PF007_g6128 [Phytophthora fragariae]KAE9199360.1 hypothetical protein PF005_g15763 [Phytophthora fragariae]KAE9246462.1 hypothetical protein PF002_g6743 [Phytophthora fragariae]
MSAVDNWTTASELISSSEPLVVVLNKTFDFRGTEDTTTEQRCRSDCIRAYMAKNNGFKSQDVILQQVTYDNAPLKRMNVKSDKAIRGVGKSGVIFGKGLTLAGDNIIVQNIHITAQPTPCMGWRCHLPSGSGPRQDRSLHLSSYLPAPLSLLVLGGRHPKPADRSSSKWSSPQLER